MKVASRRRRTMDGVEFAGAVTMKHVYTIVRKVSRWCDGVGRDRARFSNRSHSVLERCRSTSASLKSHA